MNACLRAIVRTAVYRGWGVLGIKNGYRGLVEGQYVPLHLGSVGNVIQRGGTILGSSRCEEFRTTKGRAKAFEFLKSHRVQHLITLGGDGTFRGAELFSREHKIRVAGIPCTIDNDLMGTDFSIGFDTAVNTAVQSIDKIRDTADSHGRVFVIEVMGRNTGHLALETALAVGAEFVVVPEVKFNLKGLVKKIQAGIDRGKTGSIVIVAEADQPGRAFPISKSIQKHIKRDIRTAILGHLQRGGSPSCRDRNLASRLGSAAVEFLIEGKNRFMVGFHSEAVKASALSEAVKGRRRANVDDFKLVNILSI
jgi:6-phosphofructokinase 1